MFQSWPQPQMSCTKRLEDRLALIGVGHFRMELHRVKMPRASSAMPAIGVVALLAITLKPGGSAVTLSPWLIHTSSRP